MVKTNRQTFTLATMCLGTFMAILDTSLVNLGLHSIQADLHADMATLQWVIDLYNLAYAVLILTGGTLGDLYGRRRIFVLGVLLFAAGSLVCAVAPGAATLLAGRGIAGIGAALLLPTALAILNVTYPDAGQRARAIALWGGMNGLAMAIGPTIGGVLVASLGWRSLFYAILPVAGTTLAFGGDRARAPIRKPVTMWSSRFTDLRIDQDTSNALFSSVVYGSEVRS
ncbi:MAG TPA: MFS transporter [Rhodopila sp.]|jgi:MFS family permease